MVAPLHITYFRLHTGISSSRLEMLIQWTIDYLDFKDYGGYLNAVKWLEDDTSSTDNNLVFCVQIFVMILLTPY